ncbi:MAG: alpha/beta fold hydrolase [Actinomycetota bacterium]
MPELVANDITIHYDTHGDPTDPTVLLVMGLGAQMTLWDVDFVAELVGRGFHVVRFDNRDVGLSSKTDGPPPNVMAMFMAALSGQAVTGSAYLLSDMADDAVAVLDHLGVDRAHIVGASMGGMIVQTMAIDHPDRVASLTSIMSTTGEPGAGQAEGDTLMQLMAPTPDDREAAVSRSVKISELISGPHFDEARSRSLAELNFDRCFHPIGVAHQMAAIIASGDRTPKLAELDVPTVVIHGEVDPLVTISGGEATAAAIPGAELVRFAEMGHDMPPKLWPEIGDAIEGVARRAS